MRILNKDANFFLVLAMVSTLKDDAFCLSERMLNFTETHSEYKQVFFLVYCIAEDNNRKF